MFQTDYISLAIWNDTCSLIDIKLPLAGIVTCDSDIEEEMLSYEGMPMSSGYVLDSSKYDNLNLIFARNINFVVSIPITYPPNFISYQWAWYVV